MTDLQADELRALARKQSNRRAGMLAIANELDGYEREEAARFEGMSDQALRDAIKRLNTEGLVGLYDHPQSAPAASRRQAVDATRRAWNQLTGEVRGGQNLGGAV